METILMQFQSEIGLVDIRDMLDLKWKISLADPSRMSVAYGGDAVYLYFDSETDLDIVRDDSHIEKISPSGRGVNLLIDYRRLNLIKDLVVRVATKLPCWVAVDFQHQMSGEQFICKVRSDPNWDWRSLWK